MNLQQLLVAYRQVHRLSVREAAKKIGVSYNALWRFENGKEINTKSLARILRWLFEE